MIRENEKHEGKKYLTADDYMLSKVLDKTKKIRGIEKIEKTKIFSDTDHKVADNSTLKNFVILMTCVIKEDSKFYPQLFLEEALLKV